MPYLIGTDEAGYGPNLGPLVVSATLWHVPEPRTTDLFAELAETVCNGAGKGFTSGRIPIADSKILYKSGGSWGLLESGFWPCLAQTDGFFNLTAPLDWQALLDRLAPDDAVGLFAIPWYADFRLPLPEVISIEQLTKFTAQLEKTLAATGIKLLAIRSRVLSARKFNQELTRLGNKSEVLSHTTLGLIAELLGHTTGDAVVVECDKHGGRNHYAALLQHCWPDCWVTVEQEGREESCYCFESAGRRVRIAFRVGGERFLPSALASMTSKYLRELAMRAFNSYWQKELPDLLPTAGYPVDARRFRCDIQSRLQFLGIEEEMFWRRK